ncbi:hypothetical protein H8K20_02560 [Neobittarella massiliensis]|uniref:Uncharacterized protein n=1 Tax=Neobittarella massiliensis (ex Bilen et al. 2018) TaxID=2041842 RepID=A0A8J6IIW1_9FIRM|nr:hypothetical protein [Neobittarella massiliensis]MBC3515276.1 hypothetical protein [Neobittarella massiliensis]
MIGNTTAELVKHLFLMTELKGVQAGDLTVRGAAVDGQGHFVTLVFKLTSCTGTPLTE